MPTEKVFSTGSKYPPLDPGVLRLYSNRFCPFAERSRLVLAYKNIPHEVVNIHLTEKPEWYTETINPVGQVPAIQKDDVIIYDSVIVNEYLDFAYTGEKLTPSDLYAVAKDKMFLGVWNTVLQPFYKIFYSACEQKNQVTEMCSRLDKIEKELKIRDTPFFGGDNMRMIDVLIWPHAARIPMFQDFTDGITFDTNRYPLINEWMQTMWRIPVVNKATMSSEMFTKVLEMIKNQDVDFDIALE